ncbi:MAG: metal-dependent transcriptional regulator [bacterium]
MTTHFRALAGNVSLAQQQYIEVIADLIREKGQARTCDIAATLKISMPSVSEVVRRLVDSGMVLRKSLHEIVLTSAGAALVQQLDRQQAALRLFLSDILGLPANEADKRACELEHFVDAQVVERLLILGRFMAATDGKTVKQAWQRHLKKSLALGKRKAKKP